MKEVNSWRNAEFGAEASASSPLQRLQLNLSAFPFPKPDLIFQLERGEAPGGLDPWTPIRREPPQHLLGAERTPVCILTPKGKTAAGRSGGWKPKQSEPQAAQLGSVSAGSSLPISSPLFEFLFSSSPGTRQKLPQVPQFTTPLQGPARIETLPDLIPNS
eukprot:bmy_15098T0